MAIINSNSNHDQVLLWAYERNKNVYSALEPKAISIKHAKQLQWVHVRYDAIGALAELQDYGLDSTVIDALTAEETRPRAVSLKEGVLVVLRAINTNHDASPEDMISLRIWFTENFMITARKQGRKLLSIEDTRLSLDSKTPPNSIGSLLVTLVENLADRIGEMVDTIDGDLTQFEDNMAQAEVRARLALIRRQTASIRRYLAPQRDALEALNRLQRMLTDVDVFAIRQQTDRTTRYVEDLDLARERAIFLQEELRNKVEEQQNKRMYVLSIVTAIFLPLSFLTGIFGMNVAGLPGTESGDAFFYLVLSMGVLAVGILIVMYWRKWI